MKIVIIEDEELIAEDLIDVLTEINPTIEIIHQISSVKEGIQFFAENNSYIDLIFSDIQLGDGLSFEILKQLQTPVPVIFCTAYNQYAIEAFKSNGIDYVLKPFSTKNIREALERYQQLKSNFTYSSISVVEDQIKDEKEHSTILVHYKEKIIPLNKSSVAMAYINNEQVYLKTFNNENYVVNKSLDELDQLLGEQCYRANRQHIVNRDVVKDVSTFINRKYAINLTVDFPERIMVSKEKMTSFLKWLKK